MYIKFTKLGFSNYKCIKKGSFNLDDKGVVLIKGINNDKSGSNGAGKSTLGNGLLWCLYGRTLNGKENEAEIIPNNKFISTKEFKATGGCCVSVYLQRDEIKYKVSRYRKSPHYKNSAVIKKEVDGEYTDISKCTDGETDAFIVDIIGADFDSFVYSNIFSFNNIEPFLKLSDTDKKELILPAFFINKFRSAHKKCKNNITEIRDKLQVINNEDLTLNVQESEKILRLNDLEKEIEERELELKCKSLEIKSEEEKVSPLALNIQTNEHKLDTFKSNVIDAGDKVRVAKEDYYACMKLIERENKQKTYIVSITNKINNEKLKLVNLGNTDDKVFTHKLVELTNVIESKTKYRNELISKKETCNKTFEEKYEALNTIKTTERETQSLLNTTVANLTRSREELASNNFSTLQLRAQRREIKEKYYSDECKSCTYNKMNAFFNSIDKSLEELTLSNQKAFKEKEVALSIHCKLIKYQKVLDESILEIDIEAFKLNNIDPLDKDLYAVEKGLIESRNNLKDLQHKVSNYEESLKGIDSINKEIKSLTQELNEEINKLKGMEETDLALELQQFASEEKKHHNIELYHSTLCIKINEELTEDCSNLKIIEERIQRLKEDLSGENKLISKKTSLMKDIGIIREKHISLKKKQENLLNSLEILEIWKTGFSSAGIEGFMLDSIIDSMNALIARYLGYLSNNTISLTLIPDSTLKSGDVRNKISEKVENDFGGPTYKTNSEGEKRVMDIAILFALKYIYEHITGTKYNILWLDEAFDTLDASTCGLVLNLINSLDNIDSVLVVSHIDAILLAFDSFINVIKTNGITEIKEEGV